MSQNNEAETALSFSFLLAPGFWLLLYILQI
jgi:hypothetical protein